MNHLDSLVPPELHELTEEQEAEIHRHYLQARVRIAREERRRRRRQRMAAMDAEVSSDSEVDGINKDVKNGKMDLNTPAGSTPKEELVKLDP